MATDIHICNLSPISAEKLAIEKLYALKCGNVSKLMVTAECRPPSREAGHLSETGQCKYNFIYRVNGRALFKNCLGIFNDVKSIAAHLSWNEIVVSFWLEDCD